MTSNSMKLARQADDIITFSSVAELKAKTNNTIGERHRAIRNGADTLFEFTNDTADELGVLAGVGGSWTVVFDGYINTFWYGVSESNTAAENSAAIAAALSDLWDAGGGNVCTPGGSFLHEGVSIPVADDLNYNNKRISFYGAGRGVTKFIPTHTGINFQFEVQGASTSGYGGLIEKCSIEGTDNITHGVVIPRGSGYVLHDLFIGKASHACVHMPDDVWLSRFTELKLSPGNGDYGIKMDSSGTSNYFDQCFVTFATVNAYNLRGAYSVIGALAADNCTCVDIYRFDFFSGTAGSLGSESCDANRIVRVASGKVKVNTVVSFDNETSTTKGIIVRATGSDGTVSIDNLYVIDTGGGGTVAQQLFDATDARVHIGMVTSDWEYTGQTGDPADNNGFAIVSDRSTPVALRQAGARAYLGLDKKAQGLTKLPNSIAYSVAIFLDSDGHPRYTSDGVDRRFQVGANNGDWFIEADPATNLVAGYVATATDADLTNIAHKRMPLVYTGTTANRPAGPYTGMQYFDTTLGIPIWYDGANWVDATGTTV